uniref:RAB6-interacting golgin n=1 Tax=Steinernema glaseri TaxID=37863 RepID=A0A1I7Y5I9_9BILA
MDSGSISSTMEAQKETKIKEEERRKEIEVLEKKLEEYKRGLAETQKKLAEIKKKQQELDERKSVVQRLYGMMAMRRSQAQTALFLSQLDRDDQE